MKRDALLAAGATGLLIAAILPFHQVFTTTAWRPDAFGALLGALAVAVVARRLRLHGAVAAAVSLLGLLTFTSVVHAGQAGPWPTLGALDAVRELASLGLQQVQDQPAPAEPLDGLRLLVAIEVWVLAHVTHEALVRLRRPGLALMGAATLWLTPLVVPVDGGATGLNALPFFLAAGAVLLLDPHSDDAGWTAESRPLLPSWLGVCLAGLAAVAGLFAPLVVPGYDAQAVLDVSHSNDPRGYQPIVDVGDRLQLPEPRDVLRVAAPQRLYLRLAALETFDGRTWRLGPPDVETYRPDPDALFRADETDLPFEEPIAAGTRVDVDVQVLDLENIYVPVPYQPIFLDGPDDGQMFYSLEGGFVATGSVDDNELSGQTRVGVRPGFEYRVEALVPTPAYEDLVALGELDVDANDPRVALPQPYPELGQQAESVYEQAGAATTIDKVFALQDWFIGDASEFTYSTSVPELRGDAALEQFVFNTKTGYCEYFATAMAVMLRQTGIPARVSVGFLPGRVAQPAAAPGEDAQFIVSTNDAHAWVEVYFPEYGWIRADPTPRGDGLPPTEDSLNPQTSLAEQPEADTEQPTPSATPTSPTEVPSIPRPEVTDDASAGSDAGFELPVPVRALLIVVLVVALLAAAVYGWPGLRQWQAAERGDPRDRVLAAQRRLLATATHLGVGRQPAETIDDLVARWTREGLVGIDDGRRLAELVSAAAFGDHADDATASEVRDLERRILAGLGHAIGPRQRLIAPWRDILDRTSRLVRRG